MRILTIKVLKKPPAPWQRGRRGSENPQRFTKKEQLIRYDQQAKQQCIKALATSPKEPLQLPKGPPRMSRTAIGDKCRPIRSSLTSPKLHLATLQTIFNY